ncbi:hypothetical protein F5Y18DRAFT_424840 [Xylariaceae sp. FL1019]|nr:hypothetical protein F5Y18DRAFT_424840 [Xylariaceae sp. FL1019]
MDPIKELFIHLPTTAADMNSLYQYGTLDRENFIRAVMSFHDGPSQDADRQFITAWAKSFAAGKLDYLALRGALGHYAFEKPHIPVDISSKSKQLRYQCWIFKGRKDEDNPFRRTESPAAPPMNMHVCIPWRLIHFGKCATCGGKNTKSICKGCFNTVDSLGGLVIMYCNKTCKITHWEDHKAQCRGRRMIWRAASLIHDLYLMFRKRTCVTNGLVSIKEQKGVACIRYTNMRRSALLGEQCIRHFPSHITDSEDLADAALMVNKSQDVLIDFHSFLELFLYPLCEKMEVITIAPQNARRPTYQEADGIIVSNMFNTHSVLRVTLSYGEQFAVDLTGAQYGWRDVVSTWFAWSKHRALSMHTLTHPEISANTLIDAGVQIEHISKPHRIQLLSAMKTAVMGKMHEKSLHSGVEFFNLSSSDEYNSVKQALLSSAEAALDNGLRQVHAAGIGLLYHNGRTIKITENWQQANALKNVWLTELDYIRNEDVQGGGLAVYQRRCREERVRKILLDAEVYMYEIPGQTIEPPRATSEESRRVS